MRLRLSTSLMSNQKITLSYVLVILITVIFTWVGHEFAHWLTAKLLGYESIMTMNGTFYNDGENPTNLHKIWVSAAGPILTILQGSIVFYYLNNQGWSKHVYPLLFTAFYMRFLAGLMNFISLNDEGRISAFLGIGNFTLSILVSGFLFFLVFKISKKNRLNWKFHLATYLIVMVISSILILADMQLGIRLL